MWVLIRKHMTAIREFINSQKVESEPINARLIDVANQMALLDIIINREKDLCHDISHFIQENESCERLMESPLNAQPCDEVEINFGTARKPDTEKRHVHPARAFAWSFCDLEGNTAYIRHDINPRNREVLYTDKDKQELIRQFWADETITKVGHNIAFDVLMARMAGYEIKGQIIDTLILAHIVSAGSEMTYALKPLCKKWFNVSVLLGVKRPSCFRLLYLYFIFVFSFN